MVSGEVGGIRSYRFLIIAFSSKSIRCFRNYVHAKNVRFKIKIEPLHAKTNEMPCALSEDSEQPGHPPSMIRVFAVRKRKPWILNYPLSGRGRL